MSYMHPSLSDFILGLNAANGTSFKATDFTYSAPQSLSGTWQGQVTADNTAVRLTAKAGGAYQGTKVVTYTRFNLADLTPANFPGMKCSAYNINSTAALFPMYTYWNGIQFSSEDLEDLPLVDNGDGTKTATLRAKATSQGWVGEGTILVTQGSAPIDQLITVTSLNGLNYPTDNESDTFAQMYMYPYDFTTYFDTIAPIAPGVLSSANATALANAFKAVDLGTGKALWTGTGSATSWNLNNATVVSNGLNSSSLPTNPTYKYVMALRLDPSVLTPAGVMYLHYNDPFNPDAA